VVIKRGTGLYFLLTVCTVVITVLDKNNLTHGLGTMLPYEMNQKIGFRYGTLKTAVFNGALEQTTLLLIMLGLLVNL
jgi:hypothetical protein